MPIKINHKSEDGWSFQYLFQICISLALYYYYVCLKSCKSILRQFPLFDIKFCTPIKFQRQNILVTASSFHQNIVLFFGESEMYLLYFGAELDDGETKQTAIPQDLGFIWISLRFPIPTNLIFIIIISRKTISIMFLLKNRFFTQFFKFHNSSTFASYLPFVRMRESYSHAIFWC